MMIFGGKDEKTRVDYTPNIWHTVVLLMAPFANALSQVSMKSMKKLPDTIVSSYMQVSMLIFFSLMCILVGSPLDLWREFTVIDWVIIFLGALTTITN